MKTIAAIQTSPNALLDIAELEVPDPSDDQVIVNLKNTHKAKPRNQTKTAERNMKSAPWFKHTI